MILRQTGGHWPDLAVPVGATVEKARIAADDPTLRLSFGAFPGGEERDLRIPPPWTFSSCLLAISSADIAAQEDVASLVGLEGAALTDIQKDDERIDLIFGSITISAES